MELGEWLASVMPEGNYKLDRLFVFPDEGYIFTTDGVIALFGKPEEGEAILVNAPINLDPKRQESIKNGIKNFVQDGPICQMIFNAELLATALKGFKLAPVVVTVYPVPKHNRENAFMLCLTQENRAAAIMSMTKAQDISNTHWQPWLQEKEEETLKEQSEKTEAEEA
jgi:hypothetical protein